MADDSNQARIAGLLASLIDLFAATDLDGVEARAVCAILLLAQVSARKDPDWSDTSVTWITSKRLGLLDAEAGTGVPVWF